MSKGRRSLTQPRRMPHAACLESSTGPEASSCPAARSPRGSGESCSWGSSRRRLRPRPLRPPRAPRGPAPSGSSVNAEGPAGCSMGVPKAKEGTAPLSGCCGCGRHRRPDFANTVGARERQKLLHDGLLFPSPSLSSTPLEYPPILLHLPGHMTH